MSASLVFELGSGGRPCLDGLWTPRAQPILHAATAAARRRRVGALGSSRYAARHRRRCCASAQHGFVRTTHSGTTPAGREPPPDRAPPSAACGLPLRASVLTSATFFVAAMRAPRLAWFLPVFYARRGPIAAPFVPVCSLAIMAFLCQWICCMRLPRCRVTRQHTYCRQFRLWH